VFPNLVHPRWLGQKLPEGKALFTGSAFLANASLGLTKDGLGLFSNLCDGAT